MIAVDEVVTVWLSFAINAKLILVVEVELVNKMLNKETVVVVIEPFCVKLWLVDASFVIVTVVMLVSWVVIDKDIKVCAILVDVSVVFEEPVDEILVELDVAIKPIVTNVFNDENIVAFNEELKLIVDEVIPVVVGVYMDEANEVVGDVSFGTLVKSDVDVE